MRPDPKNLDNVLVSPGELMKLANEHLEAAQELVWLILDAKNLPLETRRGYAIQAQSHHNNESIDLMQRIRNLEGEIQRLSGPAST